MLLAALFVLAFSVYFFWGDQLIPTTVPQCISWILAPAGLGWLAFVATHFRAMGRRARGRILPLSVGILLMSSSTGMMAWFLVTYVMPPTTWAQYVTIALPLLVLAFDFGMALASSAVGDEDREWLARSSAWTQLFCISWLVFCGLVVLVPGWLFGWPFWANAALAAAGALSGWLATRGSSAAAGSPAEKPPVGSVLFGYIVSLV
jgi:hypothetical protein